MFSAHESAALFHLRTCDLHRAVACDSLPGSVSRLESGKISCSLSSQQLFNDVAHLAVMKHFYPLIN